MMFLMCLCVLCTMREATINGFLIHFTWQFDLANNINTNRKKKKQNAKKIQRCRLHTKSTKFLFIVPLHWKQWPISQITGMHSIHRICMFPLSFGFFSLCSWAEQKATTEKKTKAKIINYSTITLHFSCTYTYTNSFSSLCVSFQNRCRLHMSNVSSDDSYIAWSNGDLALDEKNDKMHFRFC